MIQRAGIALSCLAYDAEFSITRLDYDPGPIFAAPTHHKLSDSHTYNGFLVSIPIGSSPEQRVAFFNANHFRSWDHFHVWSHLHVSNMKKDNRQINLLFIDLTPGQVASTLANGSLSPFGWGYTVIGDGSTSLEDVILLSTQDIYEKIVTPVVLSGVKVHRVGILHPKGVLPGISNAEVESLFVDTLVDWVTLDDLSHAAAFMMSHQPTSSQVFSTFGDPETTYLTSGITLANGELVTIVPKDEELPTIRRVILTTSQDNQTTVTVRLNRGSAPFGEVKLEGLIPRPKGQAAIKVTLQIGPYGDVVMTVEEVGTDLKKVQTLGSILYSRPGTDGTYLEMTFGKNGSVGELPE
ncbi:hypothetical protein CPB86DRAFT_791756 [Serendipita vermifera]|nr:hypothetical protein CPB86DRAFT_791756 [Serendipita vermifera]